MRIIIIALIFAFTIPAFAQDEALEPTIQYQFGPYSFAIPSGWFAYVGGDTNEAHIYNFDATTPEYKLDNLESGQVQIVASVQRLDDPRWEGADGQSYIMGFTSGSYLMRMQLVRLLQSDELEFEFEGTELREDGWLALSITSDVNDITVLAKTDEYIRAVLLITPPGENGGWVETAAAIGETLAVAD